MNKMDEVHGRHTTTELEDKKRWLQRYRQVHGRLKRSEEKIRLLRSNKMGSAIILDGLPHGHGSADLSEYAARLDSEEAAYRQLQCDCINICQEICDAIELIPDEKEKNVLTWYYIRLLDWSDIAGKMNKSKRQIYRIHRQGLKDLII